MGVHDTGVYDDIRDLLDIPEGEPLFIIRAQDKLAVPAITSYRIHAIEAECPNAFLDNLIEVSQEFQEWQSRNPVKTPD